MNAIELSGVTKGFKGQRVLTDVNLSILEGTTYGLRAPNGSGKSVLLKLLSGLLRPDEGEVRFGDKYLQRGQSFPDRFGVMINGPAYLSGMSALDNLKDLASIRRRATEEDLRALLDELDLDPDSRKKVRSFSLGMKQRLGIAQALMEDPRVLLLDEPFNALDAASSAQVHAMLSKRREDGLAIVFTSHNPEDFNRLEPDVLLRIEDRHVVRDA